MCSSDLQSSKVRFTRLKVGNEEIFPGNEYLPLDIAVSKAIRIHEREKSFSLEFSALNYESDNTAPYVPQLLYGRRISDRPAANWKSRTQCQYVHLRKPAGKRHAG